MALLLGLLIVSFLMTAVLIVPFINLLYQLKFQRRRQKTLDPLEQPTPIFDRFHRTKTGTPVGGGLLVIVVVSILFSLLLPLVKFFGVDITSVYPLIDELNIMFFTFVSFGLLGLYDDIMKFFGFRKTGFFGLRLRWKLGLQLVLAGISAVLMFVNLKIDIFYIPFIGVFHLGWWFVPAATFIITAFANAVNVADGLDGLAVGLLMIAIFALWLLSASILDTTLSMFLALWLGSIIAFLYFNIYPARIFLGDVGAMSFGATLAVVGLLLGKVMALVVIGGVFVAEIGSSLLQLLSKKIFKRKLFPVSPTHLWLQFLGWEEPKIVMRAWLAGIMLAIFGVWLAVI
jgi:phospho-N-acetylmuramoyl-pentapeptide-transferase